MSLFTAKYLLHLTVEPLLAPGGLVPGKIENDRAAAQQLIIRGHENRHGPGVPVIYILAVNVPGL